MNNKITLTQDGLDELVNELENRKTEVRKEIADDIDRARQQGDLSENAAYKSAIESKEFNENQIAKLEDMITNAEVIDKRTDKTIGIGSKVKITNQSMNTKAEYAIVGASEADPAEGKISISSPIGAALKDKKKGDTAVVDLPAGEMKLKIDSVS